MNPYPRDGGCDEGPSYWDRAGGSLYDCLELKNPEEIEDLKTVYITFDQNRFQVDFETIPIDDGRLRSSWGERLFRIVFTARETLLKDGFRFTVEQGE